MPDALSRSCVQAHEALREKIIAVSMTSVIVSSRRFGRKIHIAELRVRGHGCPHGNVPGIFPRIAFPSVVPLLAGSRDGVENPLPLAGPHVITSDVAHRHFFGRRHAARRKSVADDDDISDDDPRRARADGIVHEVDVLIQAFSEVDDPVPPEIRVGLSCLRVDRHHEVRRRDEEDALVLAVRPIRQAAARRLTRRAIAALAFFEAIDPERLAGLGVDRYCGAARAGGRVQDPVHHDRRRSEVDVRAGAEIVPVPAPFDLELRDIVSVDLVERRVARAAQITAVVRPFSILGSVLGEKRGAREHDDSGEEGVSKIHGRGF